MRLDRNSYGTLAAVYSVSAVIVAALFLWVKTPMIVWPLTALFFWFCLWQTAFFRVPRRERKGDDRKVSAVADGRIVIVEKAFEKEFLKRECLQVSIYMNFFDVHANFWPVDGTVIYYKYHPGAHFFAFKPKASEENEHTCTCVRTADGKDVFFKQIAGGFARRIVNYAEPGMQVRSGEQCGIIKFGSRIDFFLPVDCDVKVAVGDVMRACETIVADLG